MTCLPRRRPVGGCDHRRRDPVGMVIGLVVTLRKIQHDGHARMCGPPALQAATSSGGRRCGRAASGIWGSRVENRPGYRTPRTRIQPYREQHDTGIELDGPRHLVPGPRHVRRVRNGKIGVSPYFRNRCQSLFPGKIGVSLEKSGVITRHPPHDRPLSSPIHSKGHALKRQRNWKYVSPL